MGRPRKRNTAKQSAHIPDPSSTLQDAQKKDQDVYDLGIEVRTLDNAVADLDPASLVDPSLAGNADVSISDMSFLDFLGSDFMSHQPFDTESLVTDWATDLHDTNGDARIGSTGGTTALTTPSHSTLDASPSDQQDPRPFQLPPLSSPNPPEPLNSTACSCLAGLYLALDSIARLPNEVIPALRTARTAAHAAHNAIRCEICCPPIHKIMKMTATAFQNSMLIGALIPSIADAYHQILALIDAEATRAIAMHTQLTFNLSAYGGTWGEMDGSEVDECKVMDPASWRRSVRSLLKIDVYGVNTLNADGTPRFRQIGLRDLVAEMDEKSQERHAEIDALIDAGLSAPVGLNGLSASHSQTKEPHCRHVVQLARDAVENLHIA